jgi:threonyl-tRNA synthetase
MNPQELCMDLMRVRQMTQDDGHIFCSEDQIEEEAGSFISILSEIYKELGFDKIDIKLSTRPEVTSRNR